MGDGECNVKKETFDLFVDVINKRMDKIEGKVDKLIWLALTGICAICYTNVVKPALAAIIGGG